MMDLWEFMCGKCGDTSEKRPTDWGKDQFGWICAKCLKDRSKDKNVAPKEEDVLGSDHRGKK